MLPVLTVYRNQLLVQIEQIRKWSAECEFQIGNQAFLNGHVEDAEDAMEALFAVLETSKATFSKLMNHPAMVSLREELDDEIPADKI